MATSFIYPPGTDPALVITDAMIAVDHELTHVPVTSAMQMIEFCRSRLAATEARILADRYEAGASDRDVEDLARSGGTGTSKKEAKKRASRAKATNANPDIANKLESGELSPEQADVVAEAAEETDGAAACDTDLIDDIAGTSPEQGKKKAKKFVNDRRSTDDVQSKHDRQRRRRGWYRHRLANGNAAITFHGDEHSVDEMERRVTTGADAEYRKDGGRDVPRHKHPRTADQRGFDAAHGLLAGAPALAPTRPAGPNDTGTPTASRSPRNVVHVVATVDQLRGIDDTVITTPDGKPLPRSIVDEIACGCDVVGHIFSTRGELLWQSRKQRLATPAQVNGLIARDGGCVLCGAHHLMCVAHHLIPWESSAKGPSDINNLALLCGDCHTRVHQRKWTLFYDRRSETWETRAAIAAEIPPDGTHNARKPDAGRYRTTSARDRRRPQPSRPRLDEQRNNQRLKMF